MDDAIINGTTTFSEELEATPRDFVAVENPRIPLKEAIFSSWTGIDESIYVNLENAEDMWATLMKELSILAEMAREGASEKLMTLVDSAMESGSSYNYIASEFNSLVEYGQSFSELDDEQRVNVEKREIEGEFGHFWRIMGIESIFRSKVKKIVGEIDEVMEVAGNLVREIGVLCERRVVRGVHEEYLPVKRGTQPEGNIRIQSNKMMSLVRNDYPYVVVSVSSEIEDLPENMRDMLKLFERLLVRYPVEKAVGLFDFMLSKDLKANAGLNFLVVQQYAEGGKQFVKGISSGSQMALHTKRNGDFTNNLLGAHKSSGSNQFGSVKNARYTPFEFEVSNGDNILFLSANYANGFENLSNEEMERVLNMRDKSGKILPPNNIKAYLKSQENGVAVVTCREREEVVRPEFTDESISAQLRDFADSIKGKNAKVSIEGAHVHADRAISEAQIVGARIASQLGSMIDKGENTEVTLVAMVDDSHVVNSIDYTGYEEMLNQNPLGFNEVVFESSPLIYQLSLEILKHLIESHPDKLKRAGNNLYIELDDIVIELVEDCDGEFITGCVLFDAAFCYYKLFPELLNSLYQQQIREQKPTSPLGYTDIHRVMLDIYKSTPNPESRDSMVRELLPEEKVDLDELSLNYAERPLLTALENAYRSRQYDEGYIIMVLERTYHSQQKKLAALTGLLNFLGSDSIVSIMVDAESGEITTDR